MKTWKKNEKTRKSWEEFINDPKYKEYFISNEDKWFYNLENVKQFMDENSKKPYPKSKNKDEKILGNWLLIQIGNCGSNKNGI